MYFLINFILLHIILIPVEGLIICYPKSNISSDSDYMIILGAAVKGSTTSLTLQGRLDKTLEYLNNADNDLCIVAFRGKGDGENISEALAMKNYLIQYDVSQDKILVENKSTSTFENFTFYSSKSSPQFLPTYYT